jgi:hypothetical protein
MDPQTPTATSDVRQKSQLLAGCLIGGVLMAYALFLDARIGVHAGGSDSSGYLNSAKLIREGHARIPQRALPGLQPQRLDPITFVPLGFRPIGSSEMAPTYPTGLPLLFAASSIVAGWDAGPHIVIFLHAIAGALLVFGLGRQCGLSPGLAGIAAFIVATSPLYLFIALQPLSDVPALVWVTAAVMLAWRSRTGSGNLVPLAAGAVFAMSVLVRPTNILAIAPVAIALGTDWRRWVPFVLGGLPGAVFLAIYNHAAYGSMFEQGYTGVPGLLSAEWAGRTLVLYVRWLPVLLTPLAVLALGLPWLARTAPRVTLLLAVWIAVFAGFYACYYFTHEVWWSLRFVLPLFPALVVAAFLVLQRITTRITHPTARWIAGLALAITAVCWSWHWSTRLNVPDNSRSEAIFSESGLWARENLPPDAVVFAVHTSGTLLFYTDLTVVRWDHLSPEGAAAIALALEKSSRPLYAVLFPHEVQEVTEIRLPGGWTQIGSVRDVTIWRRESAEAVTPTRE